MRSAVDEDRRPVVASHPSPPPASGRPRADDGFILLGLGALALLVSLFLRWYQPGGSAWTVFGTWDLVLAVTGCVALIAAAAHFGLTTARSAGWATLPSIAAPVIVLNALLNPPPSAATGSPALGLWIALIAAVSMALGTLLAVAPVTVAIDLRRGRPRRDYPTHVLESEPSHPVV